MQPRRESEGETSDEPGQPGQPTHTATADHANYVLAGQGGKGEDNRRGSPAS